MRTIIAMVLFLLAVSTAALAATPDSCEALNPASKGGYSHGDRVWDTVAVASVGTVEVATRGGGWNTANTAQVVIQQREQMKREQLQAAQRRYEVCLEAQSRRQDLELRHQQSADNLQIALGQQRVENHRIDADTERYNVQAQVALGQVAAQTGTAISTSATRDSAGHVTGISATAIPTRMDCSGGPCRPQ